MMTISEAQKKLSELITSRVSKMMMYKDFQGLSPLRAIGESVLDRYAAKLMQEANLAQATSEIMDELLENLVNTLALAGILGVDLEHQLNEMITVLESVSSEAA